MESPLEMPLAHLVQTLHEDTDLDRMVREIVEFARSTLGTAHAGITLVHGASSPARFESVAATGPKVEEADHLQYETGEGPCLDAVATSRSSWSSDLEADGRWPTWARKVAALGFRSVLSCSLGSRGQRIGTLNLYGDRHRQFTQDDVDVAEVLSLHAGAALAAARTELGLQRALDSRLVIGQAQGILMERFDLDPAKAFEVLRRYSQHHNIKLVTIAERLVTDRTLPDSLV